MVKKFLLVLVLVAIVVTGTYAAPPVQLSVGGGFQTGLLQIGAVDGNDKTAFLSQGFEIMPRLGGFAFFDATYIEASLGFSGGSLVYWYSGNNAKENEENDESYSALNISLLGKFPFVFNKFSLFPMLGIDYLIFLFTGFNDEDEFEASDLNTLFFKIGIGGDYSLSDNLYFRGSLFVDIGPSNKFAKDTSSDSGGEPFPSIGGTFKLAIGYKF